MGRVDNIKNYKAVVDAKERQAQLDRLNELQKYKEGIIALKDRIKEIIEVGQACEANGIPLDGRAWGGHEGYDTHQFISNSWSHVTGFVVGRHGTAGAGKIVGVGKRGGGACNWELDITIENDEVVIKTEGDALIMGRFLMEFDEFEREFYTYVDKVTGNV